MVLGGGVPGEASAIIDEVEDKASAGSGGEGVGGLTDVETRREIWNGHCGEWETGCPGELGTMLVLK